jgi:F-type H+-transporting ATPase subunit b
VSLDLTVVWVIFFVLLMVAIVNSLLFKPVLKVMHQRETAVQSARALAEKASADAATAMQQYEQQTRAARAELHREMEDARRAAEARRTELLSATRADADAQLAEAKARLAEEADGARARLSSEADALGNAILERVLGRAAR